MYLCEFFSSIRQKDMRTRGLWWKLPAALLGTATALVLVLLAAAGCALYVHSVRQAVLERAVAEANARDRKSVV